jgi:hypothetical protein
MHTHAHTQPTIISRTGAAISSETNFGSTGHNHPRSNPLPRVCTVTSASAILKCIMEVVFCKGVQHRLRFCLDHCVKMAAFYLQLGKQRKEGWVWDESHIVSWWKRKCGMVCHRDATVSSVVSKVLSKFFAHFHADTIKRHSIMRDWLFGLPWALSWTCFSTDSPFFGLGEFGLFVYGSCMLSSLIICLIIVRVSVTLFPRSTCIFPHFKHREELL